jgi:hypothetical protein
MHPKIVAPQHVLPADPHAATTASTQVENHTERRYGQLEDDEPGEGAPRNLSEHVHE